MMVREVVGRGLGIAISPAVAWVSHARRARMFHPEGLLFSGVVVPDPQVRRVVPIAEALAGNALLRFSSAWWRGGKEWPDALGLAIRFHRAAVPETKAHPGDQDLLFATIRHPLTTLLAPLRTRRHDFLGNDYYAVSPFRVFGLGRAKWRVLTPKVSAQGADRASRLVAQAKTGRLWLELQLRPKGFRQRYLRVARIGVGERLDLDQASLAFSPFRDGRGVTPSGLVQAMRRPAYRASQWARSLSQGAPRLRG
jgi:hypothetical protein